MTIIEATRYHDISCGHRVVGHEGKCQFLHGHNYRVHFTCRAHELDQVGRVVDFSVIKETLCQWLEDEWDHKFLMWQEDPLVPHMEKFRADQGQPLGLYFVPFNPTAENMAAYLLEYIGPALFHDQDVELVSVTVQETRKCSASAWIEE